MQVPRALVATAFATLAALFWWVGHREWRPEGGLQAIEPQVISGDEPHYLIIVNSLLHDRDLEVQDDYFRARRGGLEAGTAHRGRALDHHTFLLDRNTSAMARWHDAYEWAHRTRCSLLDAACVGYELKDKRFYPGPSIYEVPAHPIWFSALIAAVIAPFHPTRETTEPLAVSAVALFAWLASVFTYLAGRRAGLPRSAALAAVGLLVCSPFLVYARALFAEAAIGCFLALGLWAMQARRPGLAGLAIAAATWLKPPFALFSWLWAAERLWARSRREAAWVFGVTAALGLPLIIFNYRLAHTFAIGGVDAWEWSDSFAPLAVELFSKEHGALAFVPWLWPVLVAAVRARPDRAPPADEGASLLRQIALPVAGYALVIVANPHGPGWAYGPRYWVAILPLLALAAVQLARTRGRLFTAALVVLALLSASFALPAALRYRHVFSAPPTKAWK